MAIRFGLIIPARIELIFKINVTMEISFPHRKYMANLNPAVYCAEICPLIMCEELTGTLVWPKKIELESSISDGNAPFCTYKLLSIKITRAHLNTQSMSFCICVAHKIVHAFV